MTETENPDVTQDVVNPPVEAVSTHDQSNDQENTVQVQEGNVQPESDKDNNFKAIRESNARLQLRLDESDLRNQRLERLIEEKLAPQSQPQSEEVDELADVSEDDWTTRKDVEKLAERKAKVIVKQMLAEDRNSRLKQELPDRLAAKHQDFESVVTKENVKYLQANKPHIASSLAAMTDPYAQALAAYDTIKAFCPSSASREDENKIARNASKPGTLGAAQAPSPLSEAKTLERGLTPELKRKYQKEMLSAMRGN